MRMMISAQGPYSQQFAVNGTLRTVTLPKRQTIVRYHHRGHCGSAAVCRHIIEGHYTSYSTTTPAVAWHYSRCRREVRMIQSVRTDAPVQTSAEYLPYFTRNFRHELNFAETKLLQIRLLPNTPRGTRMIVNKRQCENTPKDCRILKLGAESKTVRGFNCFSCYVKPFLEFLSLERL